MLLALLAAISLSSPPRVIHAEVHGCINATLSRKAPHAGAALAAEVARLLRWRGDVVHDVHPKDQITVVYDDEPQPELLALEYRGAMMQLSAFRFTGSDGVPRFYDQNGVLVEPVLDNPPVAYIQITAVIQHERGMRWHNGIDLKAAEGSPVHASLAGTVTRVDWLRWVNGNCVEVRTADGKLERFLHLTKVAPGVHPGAHLARGTLVGMVGNTGHSIAPHLHYEIRDAHDRVLNPLKVLGTHRGELHGTALQAFQAQRAHFEAILHPLATN